MWVQKELEVIKVLKEELKQERMTFDPKKNINKRIVNLEKKKAALEQHSCREYGKLIGLPEDTHREELENFVVQVFKTAGVNVKKHNFHTIHGWAIAKLNS